MRVAALLPDLDSAQSARGEVLKWAAKRAGAKLPETAWNHESFELLVAGRNSLAVRIVENGMDLWAIRAEDPDKEVAGRVWTTEVVIGWRDDDQPHFCMRLLASSGEDELDIEPHVPGFVIQVADSVGMAIDGYGLGSAAQAYANQDEAAFLVNLLEDPSRTLPVIVIAADEEDGFTPLDADNLARALLGIAHVAVLTGDASWALTERFGKYLAVFGGGVRVYQAGFDADTEPFQHRLFIRASLNSATGRRTAERWLRSFVANESVKRVQLGREIFSFADIRNVSLRLNQEKLREIGASPADQLEAARKAIKALEAKIEEQSQELTYFGGEHKSAEARAELAELNAAASSTRINDLIARLRAKGDDPDHSIAFPTSWAEVGSWCDKHLAGRLILTTSARRNMKKADFEDVAQAARCLLWLADTGRDRRINGGDGSINDEPIEDGIRNAHCGGDEYPTFWRGQKCAVEWHIKNGGNVRDPKRCLRIYYFWDDATQVIVVDDLPAHRRTAAT